MGFREVESRVASRIRGTLSAYNDIATVGTRHRMGNPVLRRRFVLAHWLLLGSLTVCALFAAVDALVTGYHLHAAVEAAAAIGLCIGWIALQRGARIDRIASAMSALVGTVVLTVVLTSPPADSSLVWALLFPAIPLFLHGPRIGLYHVLAFDALLFGGLGLGAALTSDGHGGTAIMNAASASAVMTILIFFYENGRADTYRLLEDAANSDPLTGLLNRRGFRDRFETELARARRTGAPISLLVLDIDHFKKINDRHGHDVGDAAIRHMAGLLTANTRRHDVVGRLGGEEFALLLPETSAHQAAMVAEKVRQLVADSPLALACGLVPLTVSIGAAQTSREASQFDPLFALADRRLYAAKEAGRNRVVAV